MDRFDLLRELIGETGDVPRFSGDEVPPAVLEEIVAAATVRFAERFPEPPWRFVIVVGEERERLIARVAEALGRHWGLGNVRPRGLASEAVLRAPALILVFSRSPASEGLDAIAHVAFAVQNTMLLASSRGLATHHMFASNLVPEAVLDYVAKQLGAAYRQGELVTMLAVGWPDEPAPHAGQGVATDWIGRRNLPPATPSTDDARDAVEPAPVLRSPGGERVFVVDTYRYNRDEMQRLMGGAGYHVEVYSSGRSLLDRIATVVPELIIISDSLPDSSGFELVRAVRGVDPQQIPLVVTTARRDSAFRIGGLAAGVDYYLRKPINPIELYTAARILLDRHRRGEELARANQELSRLLDELRRTQERLVMQAKLASLGQLVAGVAHEINTPLGAVVSNNDLFLRCFARLRKTADERGLLTDPVVTRDLRAVEELAEVTRTACARITNIVHELRTFARLDEADRKAVDLHEGLESTLVLCNYLIKGRIEVVREYGDLPAVECHPNQLNQVFMNLIVNACHAIRERGTITLRTWFADSRAHISVADTGTGITPDHLARIFDPGFTTKGAGVGTGLGLSICYQIAQHHHGEITVDSTVGKGTTFTVSLPAAR